MTSVEDLARAAFEGRERPTNRRVAVSAIDKALNDSGYRGVVTGAERLRMAEVVVIALGLDPSAYTLFGSFRSPTRVPESRAKPNAENLELGDENQIAAPRQDQSTEKGR